MLVLQNGYRRRRLRPPRSLAFTVTPACLVEPTRDYCRPYLHGQRQRTPRP